MASLPALPAILVAQQLTPVAGGADASPGLGLLCAEAHAISFSARLF